MGAGGAAKAGGPKPEPLSLQEQIERRAYEIYLQHGGQDESDLDDWLQAEAEIRQARGQE